MGYLFLTAALAAGLIKGFCGKTISGKITDSTDSFIINFMRMVLCTVIGFILAFASSGKIDIFRADAGFLLLSLMSGVFSSAFIITWVLSVKTGAYAMVETFIMAGTAVPMIGASLIFKESVSPVQWAGFTIVIAGVLILCSYNNSVKAKINLKSLLLLLSVGLSNGFADLSQKLFTGMYPDANNAVFNFYTYVFSALVIGVLLAVKRVKIPHVKSKITETGIYIIIMAIALFANSYFKVEAARLIDAAKLYPLNQGAALALSTIMASVFFGEKIKPKCVLGLVLGFAGICIMNMF